jgi:hypothetical protein
MIHPENSFASRGYDYFPVSRGNIIRMACKKTREAYLNHTAGMGALREIKTGFINPSPISDNFA